MARNLLTLFIISLSLCSCSDREELITFPPGDYISDCTVEGMNSSRTELTIERDFKTQTEQRFIYTGVTNCSGERTAEAPAKTSEVLIVFSNKDLGNNFSYLTITSDQDGEQVTEYIAFRYENSRLYFSPSVSSLEDDPKQTFADFIAEPDFIADLILTRKDLNRPLSKN